MMNPPAVSIKMGGGPSSSHVLIDQNESILVNIMCKYEEMTSHSQKLDILKGNIVKLAVNQTGSKFL